MTLLLYCIGMVQIVCVCVLFVVVVISLSFSPRSKMQLKTALIFQSLDGYIFYAADDLLNLLRWKIVQLNHQDEIKASKHYTYLVASSYDETVRVVPGATQFLSC